MESFLKDIRFAFRTLWTRRGFTTAAVLSLGLGIGANSTIFTLVNAAFLRSVPVADPDRVVVVYGAEKGGGMAYQPTSWPNYRDLRARTGTLSGLAAFQWLRPNLLYEGVPERLFAQIVTDNYFEVLGIDAARGRVFVADDFAARGGGPVVVLSDAFWTRRFGADPGIVGRTILLNGRRFTVVGVGPRGFKGTNTFNGPDLWIPMSMFELMSPLRSYLDNRGWQMFDLLGRLRPGSTLEQAETELRTLAATLEKEYPDANRNQSLQVLPLSRASIEPRQREVYVRGGLLLMIVVGLLLLIACANVASLLLTRGIGRRKEIAVRISLGSSRGRLVRQLLTESLVLSLVGGALGILLALWGPQLLWRFRPPFFTETALDLGLNGRIVLYTLAISVVTGVLFGLAPALQAFRTDLVPALKDQGGARRTSRRGLPLRHLLIVSQVALSLLALVGAGLFLRSLRNAQQIDPGFDTRHIVTINFDIGGQGYDEVRGRDFYRRAVERVAALPGVRSASVSSSRPLHRGALYRRAITDQDDAVAAEQRSPFRTNTVGLHYFATLGIPLLQGRDFRGTDRPDTPLVAIVNQTMAEALWPGQIPVGKRFRIPEEELDVEVVGVAADARYESLGEAPQPLFYFSIEQMFMPEVTLQVRTQGEPKPLVETLRREVQALDPTLPLANVRTMQEEIDITLWGQRMAAVLLSAFGLLALVLASTGIYGVMSYSVRQRTREMGIRMALGARRGDVVALVLRQAMAIVGLGLAFGLIGAAAGARVLTGLLYGLSGADPQTFLMISLLLAAVALLASFLAAHRGTRIDPLIALRTD